MQTQTIVPAYRELSAELAGDKIEPICSKCAAAVSLIKTYHPALYADAFRPSGRFVVVTEDSPVRITPHWCHNSYWSSAELRVDSKLAGYGDQALLMTCCLTKPKPNRWAAHESHTGRNHGTPYIGREEGIGRTFYFEGQHGLCAWAKSIPLARLVAYDPTSGAHTFELDKFAYQSR